MRENDDRKRRRRRAGLYVPCGCPQLFFWIFLLGVGSLAWIIPVFVGGPAEMSTTTMLVTNATSTSTSTSTTMTTTTTTTVLPTTTAIPEPAALFVNQTQSLDLGANGMLNAGDIITITTFVQNVGDETAELVMILYSELQVIPSTCIMGKLGNMTGGQSVVCTATYAIRQQDIVAATFDLNTTVRGEPMLEEMVSSSTNLTQLTEPGLYVMIAGQVDLDTNTVNVTTKIFNNGTETLLNVIASVSGDTYPELLPMDMVFTMSYVYTLTATDLANNFADFNETVTGTGITSQMPITRFTESRVFLVPPVGRIEISQTLTRSSAMSACVFNARYDNVITIQNTGTEVLNDVVVDDWVQDVQPLTCEPMFIDNRIDTMLPGETFMCFNQYQFAHSRNIFDDMGGLCGLETFWAWVHNADLTRTANASVTGVGIAAGQVYYNATPATQNWFLGKNDVVTLLVNYTGPLPHVPDLTVKTVEQTVISVQPTGNSMFEPGFFVMPVDPDPPQASNMLGNYGPRITCGSNPRFVWRLTGAGTKTLTLPILNVSSEHIEGTFGFFHEQTTSNFEPRPSRTFTISTDPPNLQQTWVDRVHSSDVGLCCGVTTSWTPATGVWTISGGVGNIQGGVSSGLQFEIGDLRQYNSIMISTDYTPEARFSRDDQVRIEFLERLGPITTFLSDARDVGGRTITNYTELFGMCF